MKRLGITILFQCFLLVGLCQGANEIKVIDAISNTPLDHAKVKLDCSECPEFKSTTVYANEKGIVNIPNQQISSAIVSHVGYHTIKLELNELTQLVKLEPHHEELNDIVVTAQYKPENPEKAVHLIKIIDRKKIDSQGAINLRDILKNESNIRISQDYILGSSTSIQGLSGQNVKILIDGIPVIGRQGGNIDLSQINLNDIERIEIIEGPLSVEYGTNALAGTINLISKKGGKNKSNFGVDTYYESVGQYNLSGQYAGKLKNTGITISGGRNFFDGWSPSDEFLEFPTEEVAGFNRVSQWKPKEQLFGKVQINQKVNKLTVGLTSRIFTENIFDRGMPRTPYFESAFDQNYFTQRFDNSLRINGKVGDNSRINLLFSKNDYLRRKNTYFKDLITLDENLSGNISDQDTTISNLYLLRGTYSTSRDSVKINYSLGYDINIENGKGSRIVNRQKQIGDYAVFGSLEYNPKNNITLRPGLRYSYNTAYNAPITPSINAKIELNKITLRGTYSKGFRSPSIKDLFFNFVDINHNIQGNPDLLAERSDNFNISLSHSKFENNRLYKFTGSIFYNDIRNLITLANGGDNAFTYFNVDRLKTVGLQLNTSLSLKELVFSIGGSYSGNDSNLPDEIENNQYYFSPEIRSSVEYRPKNSDYRIAAFYKYTGEVTGFVYVDDSDLQEIFLDDYHNLDVTISKPFLDKKLNVTIGLKNLFDVKDIQATTGSRVHSSDSGTSPLSWGRSVFTSINFTIKNRKS